VALGGRIELASEEGRGSSFALVLPAKSFGARS
jgi:signal transduction histidine kinase